MLNLTDDERREVQIKGGIWNGSVPPGTIVMHDSNAVIRGDMDAVDGIFAGTVSANRLNVLSKLNIRGGSVSSYLTVGRRDLHYHRIVVPQYFGSHNTFIDLSFPMVFKHPSVGAFWEDDEWWYLFGDTTINLYRNGHHIDSTYVMTRTPGYWENRRGDDLYHGGYLGIPVGGRFFDFEPMAGDTTYEIRLSHGRMSQTYFFGHVTVGVRIK